MGYSIKYRYTPPPTPVVGKLAVPPGQIKPFCMNPWMKARLLENTEISRELQ